LKDEITAFSRKSFHAFAFLSGAKEPPMDETVEAGSRAIQNYIPGKFQKLVAKWSFSYIKN
jgi:hypothetical protein